MDFKISDRNTWVEQKDKQTSLTNLFWSISYCNKAILLSKNNKSGEVISSGALLIKNVWCGNL